MQRSISQIGRQRRMVEQVRVSGGKIASKLRPVQTIEKSGFRVGRVLDGYSSEAAQYTVQNQIRYFAHRLLRHVDLVEPPPAFPVGRIVPPKKGEKVKRVSRLFQTKKATPTKSKTTPNKIKTSEALKSFASKKIASNTRKVVHTRKTTPTIKLHSAIQSEIVSFSYSDLEPVEPKVKLTLPSARDIEREKAEMAEAMGNEQKTKKVVSNKSPLFAKKKAKLKSKKK